MNTPLDERIDDMLDRVMRATPVPPDFADLRSSLPPARLRIVPATLAAAVVALGIAGLVVANGRDTRENVPGTAGTSFIPSSSSVAGAVTSPSTPSPSSVPAETVPSTSSAAKLTVTVDWYELPGEEPSAEDAPQVVCRTVDAASCAEIVGLRQVGYRGTTVRNEYWPEPSTTWQMLVGSTATEINGHAGYIADDGTVGLEVSGAPTLHVIVTGERALEVAEQLVPVPQTLEINQIFGQASATDDEMSGGSAARYYAGYVETAGANFCIGAIGMPWNQYDMFGECNEIPPGETLHIHVASPSPTGTILIGSAPANAARVVAATPTGETRDLTVVPAPELGIGLIFADLDDMAPNALAAYTADGTLLASAPVVSTGGAPLGFLPQDP